MGRDVCFYSPWRALLHVIRNRWRHRRHHPDWHPLDEWTPQ